MHSWYAEQEKHGRAPRGSLRGRIIAAAVAVLVLAVLVLAVLVAGAWLAGGIGSG